MSNNDFGKLFAKNLNYFIELRGKTQQDLANDLGISKATISSWCNATRIPRMDKVDLLCKYLNVNRSDLMEDNKELKSTYYYMDNDTREIAQEIYVNPDLKILFDATRGLSKDDVDAVLNIVERLKSKNK